MEMKQYLQLIQSNSEWLPGKDAIMNAIKRCYNVTPRFVDIQEMNLNNSTLNGFFIYKQGDECIKLTTCGLTQVLPNEYAFKQNCSGWGAEITVALSISDNENTMLYAGLLAQLAQYVNVRKNMFKEYSRIALERVKCRGEFVNSKISGLIFVHDAMLESIGTVHGDVDFLQIIGVNGNDWKKIKKTPMLIRQYIYESGKYNTNYCIDQNQDVNILE